MTAESQHGDALHGVQIVFQLPYHADESIDFDTLGAEIEHIFAEGADGLVMAMVTERVGEGVAFMPFHFGGHMGGVQLVLRLQVTMFR